MFIDRMSVDDEVVGKPTLFSGRDLTPERLDEAIRGLDGHRQTLVMLGGPGEAHMGIGGDAHRGLVVYATFDNRSFHQLLAPQQRPEQPVRVVAGGQPIEYKASEVVGLEAALAAARTFATSGVLDPAFSWRET